MKKKLVLILTLVTGTLIQPLYPQETTLKKYTRYAAGTLSGITAAVSGLISGLFTCSALDTLYSSSQQCLSTQIQQEEWDTIHKKTILIYLGVGLISGAVSASSGYLSYKLFKNPKDAH